MYGKNKNPYNSVRNININIDTPKKEEKIQYNILYNIYNIIQNLKKYIIIIIIIKKFIMYMKIDKLKHSDYKSAILMVGAVQTNKINVYIMCINVRRDYRCNIL